MTKIFEAEFAMKDKAIKLFALFFTDNEENAAALAEEYSAKIGPECTLVEIHESTIEMSSFNSLTGSEAIN